MVRGGETKTYGHGYQRQRQNFLPVNLSACYEERPRDPSSSFVPLLFPRPTGPGVESTIGQIAKTGEDQHQGNKRERKTPRSGVPPWGPLLKSAPVAL